MARRRLHAVADSTASPEVVFAILADALTWPDWVPALRTSSYERTGSPGPHGLGAIRRFGLGLGLVSREEVVDFRSPALFSYVILSGFMPVTEYRGDVVLSASAGGTRITWDVSYRSWVPGIERALRAAIHRTATKLARQAEHVSSTP